MEKGSKDGECKGKNITFHTISAKNKAAYAILDVIIIFGRFFFKVGV